MVIWGDNLEAYSGSMLAALEDMGWLIFVIIAILSQLFGGKKKQEEEQPLESGEQPPPQQGASKPSNLEEELRRLLSGGSDQQPMPPVEEPPELVAPPVIQSASPTPEPEWEPEPVVETATPLHEAKEAYQQASQLHESVAERMKQVHTHHAAPVAITDTDATSVELREVITMVRQPKTARQAIVASVILGSPKGLEI